MAKSIAIEDIELLTEGLLKIPIPRQYQVEFSVGNTTCLTTKAKEAKNRTIWEDKLEFDVDDHSVIIVKVYQKHRIRKTFEQVTSLSGNINELLDKRDDGVLDIPLVKDGAHGPVIIKFRLRSRDAKAQAFNDTWAILLQRLELFDKVVADIAGISLLVLLALSTVANKLFVNLESCDDEIIRLAGAMSDVFRFIHEPDPMKTIRQHSETIKLLIWQVTECGYFISEYAKQGTWPAEYSVSDIHQRITECESMLLQVKMTLLEDVSLKTGLTLIRMMNVVVGDDVEPIDLWDMSYAAGAGLSLDEGCLAGTRKSLLREICDVLGNPDENAPRVCLLTGVAGSGKSVVAHSIARLYDEQQQLGSSYYFSSSDVARRNPHNLFSTIAHDLAARDPQYRSALWKVVRDNQSLRMSLSPSEQLERFIIEPTRHLHPVAPFIIVIDALDESGDKASCQLLLHVIYEKLTKNTLLGNTLPRNLRFLITTRSESNILSMFLSDSNIIHICMDNISLDTVDRDIYKFIYSSLHQCTELEVHWPNQEWCQMILHSSQHLFQWASTACGFIQGCGAIGLSPSEGLKILVQNEKSAIIQPLDQLYVTILDQVFTSSKTQQDFQEVMAIILTLKEPLSLKSLSILFKSDKGLCFRDVLSPLGSLLDGVIDEEKPIQPFHTSFWEFLLDVTCSSNFYVHIQPKHSLCLGQALLECMQNMLRFNICDLKNAQDFNTSIPDLAMQVKDAIPPYLVYSCQYWMVHLGHVDCTPDILNKVTFFFKQYLPYWIEAISLLSTFSPHLYIQSAIETCVVLRKWSKDAEIAILASEMLQFIHTSTPVLRKSTPHLYLSAMPQTPSSSPLHKFWHNHLQKYIQVTSEKLTSWPACMLLMKGHTNCVKSVAYSPDGSHIVSGSLDNTIRIWNATTGQLVAGPFERHSDQVLSVDYSPNGTHVVSGSADGTIGIWNVSTGQLVTGPFKGHSNWVCTVAYSPDSTHVVSGSVDETIRVWNATTSKLVAGPFLGHLGCVQSVVYSPDGIYIASGSSDKTIRVWNATTGQPVAGPFVGHSSDVLSVAYSPDGTHIVSGSLGGSIRVWNAITGKLVADLFRGNSKSGCSVAYSSDGTHIVFSSDELIRVWNASTGQLVADPLRGHSNQIKSVAYSPNSTHIVSGSFDHTIRIWNVPTNHCIANGDSVLASFIAYSSGNTNIVSGSLDKTIKVWNATPGQFIKCPDGVLSIACSPDGNNIASGCLDYTIRVWNATTGQLVASPFKGHSNWVMSVAYSPNGAHIVSGSSDQTIRIWNASTGQLAAGPFEGHSNWVQSVAYSPNGIHIVSGSSDKTIRIWNAMTGQLVAGPFGGFSGWIFSVAYSPDGTHIVSASRNKTIRVWNVITGHLTVSLKGHSDQVLSVAYSPDGTHIVSGSRDKTVRVWNAITGQLVAGPFLGHSSGVLSVAYSPNGTHIVSGSLDFTIMVWNTITGQLVAGPFKGHSKPVWSVAYSPDGTRIVSGSQDGTIRLWNAPVHQAIATSQLENDFSYWHTDLILSTTFSLDSTQIISGSLDKTIRIWDAITGQLVAGPYQGHIDSVFSVIHSPDGASIISGSLDNTITVWTAITGQPIIGPFQGHTASVTSIAHSPNGEYIASGSLDKTVRIWCTSTGLSVAGPFYGHQDSICSVAYSPNGKYVVSGSMDKTIRVWKVTTGQLAAGPFQRHTDTIFSVAYFPDGTRILSGSGDMTLRIWNVTTGRSMITLHGHTGSVLSLACSPDGASVVSGSADKTVRIWDATTGQCIAGPFQNHRTSVMSVAYSSDGNQIVSSSADQIVRTWITGIAQPEADLHQKSFIWSTADIYSGDPKVRAWKIFQKEFLKGICKEDGWIHLPSGNCIGWIAPWNRPDNLATIFSNNVISFEDFILSGESWVSCWE